MRKRKNKKKKRKKKRRNQRVRRRVRRLRSLLFHRQHTTGQLTRKKNNSNHQSNNLHLHRHHHHLHPPPRLLKKRKRRRKRKRKRKSHRLYPNPRKQRVVATANIHRRRPRLKRSGRRKERKKQILQRIAGRSGSEVSLHGTGEGNAKIPHPPR